MDKISDLFKDAINWPLTVQFNNLLLDNCEFILCSCGEGVFVDVCGGVWVEVCVS